jgi:hypothetical protein
MLKWKIKETFTVPTDINIFKTEHRYYMKKYENNLFKVNA